MRKDWEKWSDMVVCCLFNDTATTEINTYGHTLARPDALPICLEARSLMRILVTRPREDAAGLVTALTARGHAVLLEPLLRSEEHTSELQSLMRTSYAVFCLKKQMKRAPNARVHYDLTALLDPAHTPAPVALASTHHIRM